MQSKLLRSQKVLVILILGSILPACAGKKPVTALDEFTPEKQPILTTESGEPSLIFQEISTKAPSPPATTTPKATLTSTSGATATVTTTDIPTMTATSSPTSSPTQISRLSLGIVVYLVFLGGGSEDTCSGYTVPVPTGITASGEIKRDVATALNYLFSIGVQYSGNLYNPLYRSKLTVNSVEFKKSSNDITVYMGGSFSKPKTDCDKRLYRAQVWDTIRQFPEVKRAHVWVGKLKLGDLLAVDY